MKRIYQNITTNYNTTPVFSALFISVFIYLWHRSTMEIPSFDSIRYFDLISVNNIFTSSEIKLKNCTWTFFLSLFNFLKPGRPDLNLTIFVNNFLSLSLLFYALNDFIEKKIKDNNLLLVISFLMFSLPFFNITKVLLPEIFSFAITLKQICFLKSEKNTKNKFYIFVAFITAVIANPSTLIIQLIIFTHYFFYKNNKRTFLYPFFIIAVTILIKSFPLLHYGLPARSWITEKPLFLSSFFIKIFGSLSYSTNFIWFISLITVHSDPKQFIRNIFKYKYSLLFYFVLVSWLKPESTFEFIHTGYRYILPLNIFLIILWQKNNNFLLLRKRIIATSLPLTFLIIANSYSLPYIKDIELIYQPFKNFPALNLLSFKNKIVSGHINSQALNKPKTSQQLADLCSRVIKEKNLEDKLLFTISNDEHFHHYMKYFQIISHNKYFVYGEQKNPTLPGILTKKVNLIKNNYSYLQSLPNTIILMLISDYIVFHESSTPAEKSLYSIYHKIKSFFHTQKDYLSLIKSISIKDEAIEIYENPIARFFSSDKSVKISKNSAVIIWDEEDLYNEAFLKPKVLEKYLTDKDYEVLRVNHKKLLNTLIKNFNSILILPYNKYWPLDITTELADFISRGGRLLIIGNDPLSAVYPKNNLFADKLNTFLDYSSGIKHFSNLDMKPIKNKYNFKINKAAISNDEPFNTIDIMTGSRKHNIFHHFGNFFPHRENCAQTYNLITSEDLTGNSQALLKFINFTKEPVDSAFALNKTLIISTPILFKDISREDMHSNLDKIFTSLSGKLNLIDFYPSNPISGKSGDILKLKIQNNSSEQSNYDFILMNDNKFIKKLNFMLKPYQTIKKEVRIEQSDKELNTYTLKSPSLPFQQKECITLNKNNNRKSFPPFIQGLNKKTIQGINYYPSSNYDLFWLQPDFNELLKDFQYLKKHNFNAIRMHFINPDWYCDTSKNHHLNLPEPIYNWQETLKMLLILAELNDIYVILDLFTFTSYDMGSPYGWKVDDDRFTNKEKIENQDIFLYDLLNTTKNFENLILDLINEPVESKALLYWSNEKIKLIKSFAPKRIITIGGLCDYSLYDNLDFFSPHFYFKNTFNDFYDKPIIAGEVYLLKINSSIYQNTENLSYKNIHYNLKKFNAIFPWCFATPKNLYSFYSIQENWESSLGIIKRSDGTKSDKKLAIFFKKTG